MNFPSKLMAAAPLLIAMLGLGACSNQGQLDERLLLGKSVVDMIYSPKAEVDLAEIIGDQLFIIARYQQSGAAMIITETDGDRVKYKSPDNVYLVLRNGFLSHARGLGSELEAFYIEKGSVYLDTAALKAAVDTGSEHRRFMEYWQAQTPVRERFMCTFSSVAVEGEGTGIAEDCTSLIGPNTFRNIYAYDTEGRLVQSSQWFHPRAEDNLLIEHTVRQLQSSDQ